VNDYDILVNYGYSVGECARIRIFLHEWALERQNTKSEKKIPNFTEQHLNYLYNRARRTGSDLHLTELRKYADKILEESRNTWYV